MTQKKNETYWTQKLAPGGAMSKRTPKQTRRGAIFRDRDGNQG